jgi:hypothetical protein
VVRGDLIELAGHRGTIVMIYTYPPVDLTLADAGQVQDWADPTSDWVSATIEVLGEALRACHEWRYITVPEARQAVLCDDRGLQTVLGSERRVALASERVLVLVHATVQKQPGYGCDPLATPCPPADDAAIAFIEHTAIDVARRMLAEA